MKNKNHTKCLLAATAVAGFMLATAASASAAITLVSSDFESGLTGWTLGGGASYYIFDTLNQPSANPDHNYASGGIGAARLPGNDSSITTATTLQIAGFVELSITVSNQFFNGSTTRRAHIEYSDNGGDDWVSLGTWDTAHSGGNESIRTVTVTLTPGEGTTRTGSWRSSSAYTGAAFTDDTLIRFRFNTNNSGHIAFFDDITITGVIPEPATALLGGLGFLMLLRRRRN